MAFPMFPIDLGSYKPVSIKLSQKSLTAGQREQLRKNIQLVRDAIVFFTGLASAKGVGGHTGGAYDIVPEVLIADGFMKGNSSVHPVLFDEAGHRVAIQYLMAVLEAHLPAEQLLRYREFKGRLPGHPEIDITPGIKFSSGRLGHLWPFANGVARANPGKRIIVFSSDGSQQEGNDAEAARFAVAKGLDIKLVIDDNNVTIAGHPSDYMKGFDLQETLAGHGLHTDVGDGEDFDALYTRMRDALLTKGPVALINRRKMAIGIPEIEGRAKAHDAVSAELAVQYLEKRGHGKAVAMIQAASRQKSPRKGRHEYLGSSRETAKNRDEFGKITVSILRRMNPEQRKERVLVIDNDLEGSQGLHHIRKAFPDVFVSGGVMERGNFSVAAGFGSKKGRQGIFSTFSAFLEMVVSEITMARLNHANVLAHFSHAGVDYIADNTCHFGINNFFADGGLDEHDTTRLYFPADAHQMRALLEKVFFDEGLRFVFSTRSATPYILDEQGKELYKDYTFEPGKDELVRDGKDGYVVAYGEMLYRALDAVERLRKKGMHVGLVNKPTLNVVDEDMMKRIGNSGFVLVVESQNINTGLGSRFGTWLLERGLKPTYAHLGTTKAGQGGQEEQIPWQGLDSASIVKKVMELRLKAA